MNNIIHLIGRVTHDLEVTEYPETKRTRVKFSIAVKNYSKKEEPFYFDIQGWNGVAERAIQLLSKGKEVHLVGRMQYFTFDKNVEGTKVPTKGWFVSLTDLHVPGKKSDSEETPQTSAA